MSEIFQKKCEGLKKIFAPLSTESRYKTLIEMGKNLPPFPKEWKTPERIVQGCQSTLYLHSHLENGEIFFEAAADALISAGLAALLIAVYSGEAPETILKCPPDFIKELGLAASLSPNRSNGLANIHLRMKQEALNFLLAGKTI